jgi:hypothetical protein
MMAAGVLFVSSCGCFMCTLALMCVRFHVRQREPARQIDEATLILLDAAYPDTSSDEFASDSDSAHHEHAGHCSLYMGT